MVVLRLAQPCQLCRNLDVLVRAAFVGEVPGHDDDIRARVKAVQMIDDKPQLDIGLRHAAVGLTSGPDVQVGELGDQHAFARGDSASRTPPRGRFADEGAAGSLPAAPVLQRLPPAAGDRHCGATKPLAGQLPYRAGRPYVAMTRTVARLLLLIMNPIMAALASGGSSSFSIFKA